MSVVPNSVKHKSPLPSRLCNPNIITTTLDANGLSKVATATQHTWEYTRNDTVGFNTIYTNEFSPDMNGNHDHNAHAAIMASGKLGLVLPGGTVCRMVDFSPGDVQNPMMHRTQSLDFGVVLEGEILLGLDDGSSTLLKRGDVAIQRGTMHLWRNPSQSDWARMMFVLQDSKPLFVGDQRLKEDLGHGKNLFSGSGNDS